MKKTAFWIVSASLLFSLMVGAAVGRMAGGGSAGDVATWSPPLTVAPAESATSVTATPIP